MDKFNKILKNVLTFLIIFLIINYIAQSCQNKATQLNTNPGSVTFTSTANEFSRREDITVNIFNDSKEAITIPKECPGEPFDVYRFENNNWVQKTAAPKLDCSTAVDLKIEAGKELKVAYTNWNNALFGDMGRYKISFNTTIAGKVTTFTTNEFLVVKEGIFRQLFTGLFYRPIYNGLIFLAYIAPNHDLGIAILLLTILIRTILLVPSQKSMKSQRRMQDLQPRLNKIKEQYKGDQQKIAMETMAVWKEAKISPFGSCLPILMQFPFLIALFYVIKNGLNPDNTFMMYSQYNNFSLSDINTGLFGILDLTKPNLYVLPLIIGGLQFIQMKLSFMKNAKKQEGQAPAKNEMAMANNMMTYVMPVMIAVFTASLPAGVGIYWGTSTSYGIIQQLFVNKGGKKKDPEEPTVRVING
ncbi:MAG: YidC/Oxa1 family membrane protein insertase [Candidatus Peregrinibacteria bacterium]|nr:YidC/Oxa1 family membrane protein insertase [Candidatus Peregrinibacteria bacterium]